MGGEACEDCNGRGWIDLPGGHVAEIVEENNRFEAEITTLRARVAELEAALRKAVAQIGAAEAIADWSTIDDAKETLMAALNTSAGPVGDSAGGEHER